MKGEAIMKIFNKSDKLPIEIIQDKMEEEKKVYEYPKICTFNLNDKNNNILFHEGYNLFRGSLGSLIRMKNEYNAGKCCLLLSDVPENLHEYNILIFDMLNVDEIEYENDDHKRKNIKGSEEIYFYCRHPRTIFDPRPYSGFLVNRKINEMSKRESIIIIFADYSEDYEYELAKTEGSYAKVIDKIKKSNYSFLPHSNRYSGKKYGNEVKVLTSSKYLKRILDKYLDDIEYHAIFRHPTVWKGNTNEKSDTFFPLMMNNYDEIISYAENHEEQWVFVFPDIKNRGEFLKELLNEFFPIITPEIFPEHVKSKWIEEKDYYLPNQTDLEDEKKRIEDEYEIKIDEIDKKIKLNYEKFSFLHEMLIESSDPLVSSIIKYLKWSGFENVLNMDEINPDKKEEDIRIELEDGIIIIEAKGLGGTSTDNDCAQISKIRSRLCEERESFDVYGLYIVNHQRHLPPLKREHPPFSIDQINDAEINKRGILTTWMLYNIFMDEFNGLISKKQIRADLRKVGLIEFTYDNLVEIGKVKEIFDNGKIIIVELNNIEISTGDKGFIKNGSGYVDIKFESIQVDGVNHNNASHGEIGIKISQKASVDDILLIERK